MERTEMLLCLGIYEKVTRISQNKTVQGPHLSKWSVQLLKMTENTFPMTARFEWVFHLRTFHITTDECGDTNTGDQTDMTL